MPLALNRTDAPGKRVPSAPAPPPQSPSHAGSVPCSAVQPPWTWEEQVSRADQLSTLFKERPVFPNLKKKNEFASPVRRRREVPRTPGGAGSGLAFAACAQRPGPAGLPGHEAAGLAWQPSAPGDRGAQRRRVARTDEAAPIHHSRSAAPGPRLPLSLPPRARTEAAQRSHFWARVCPSFARTWSRGPWRTAL